MSAAAKKTNPFEGAKKVDGGMLFKGMNCEPITEQCDGCERTAEFEGEKYCVSYPLPSSKWELGACNFATHVRAEVEAAGKVKINPLKASKRAARGR